uniref:SAM domain-containing protein n=2 Tax=Rhodosorus marinus TaxID=101924 RepID=A0A7S2ZTG3_9RHOD|mmetsp:Transcript_31329/g.120975  ORF Transcript_31329/g.120975 Transcript_31329/m.120975 type:complete len:223 (+) Transcript_31329:74-742(+)
MDKKDREMMTTEDSAVSGESSSVAEAWQGLQTSEDVANWLRELGKDEYISTFMSNEINGEILASLTSEELRDDLGVINLKHRRELLTAIKSIGGMKKGEDTLPEHGRILDHLSNVRTFHSWVRVGVQLLAFALVSLRLFPTWRENRNLITGCSLYYSCVGAFAILYGLARYALVVKWIEESGVKTPKYHPDKIGVAVMLVLVLVATALTLYVITLDATPAGP